MFPRPVGRAGSVGGRAGWAFSPLLHLCSAPPTAALRPHPLCRRPPLLSPCNCLQNPLARCEMLYFVIILILKLENKDSFYPMDCFQKEC